MKEIEDMTDDQITNLIVKANAENRKRQEAKQAADDNHLKEQVRKDVKRLKLYEVITSGSVIVLASSLKEAKGIGQGIICFDPVSDSYVEWEDEVSELDLSRIDEFSEVDLIHGSESLDLYFECEQPTVGMFQKLIEEVVE